MLDKIKKNWMLIGTLIILGGAIAISCLSIGDKPVLPIDQMAQSDFDILTQEVRTFTRIGIRQVIEKKPELKEPLSIFIEHVKDVIDSTDDNIQDLNAIINNLINGLDDPDIQDALKLAWLLVQQHGGLQWIEIDAEKMLSPRSLELIGAILGGINDVVSAK